MNVKIKKLNECEKRKYSQLLLECEQCFEPYISRFWQLVVASMSYVPTEWKLWIFQMHENWSILLTCGEKNQIHLEHDNTFQHFCQDLQNPWQLHQHLLEWFHLAMIFIHETGNLIYNVAFDGKSWTQLSICHDNVNNNILKLRPYLAIYPWLWCQRGFAMALTSEWNNGQHDEC